MIRTPRNVPPVIGRTPPASRRRRGFALLITITLLAFVVLLLVSLASLTRVETQVASNHQEYARARQHALFALNLALGQLQQHLGPDQRITAPADIAAASSGASPPRWTGVWREASPGDNSRDPELLTWLVSGNEDPSAPLQHTPADSVDDPSSAADSPSVWLVNSGSVNEGASPDPRIKLPRQPIRATGVPGLADVPGGHVVGHYAWWVGDEGMKARVSLNDPHANSSASVGGGTSERIYSFLTPPVSGLERVTDSDDNFLAGLDRYQPAGERLGSVLSHAQLPLVTNDAALSETLRRVARDRFHDLTTVSASVPADVARGGLRKDLTAWLSSASPVSGAPAAADFITAPVGGDEAGLPRWGLVRSWFADFKQGQTVTPRPQQDDVHGVYPVITYIRLGLGLSCEDDGRPLRVHLFPMVVLWNPFNVTLAATDYEVGFAVPNPTPRIEFRERSASGALKTTLYLRKAVLDDPAAPDRLFRFTVRAPEIPPGQSLVFSIADDENGSAYSGGGNLMTADAINPKGNSVVLVPSSPSATLQRDPDSMEFPEIFWVKTTWTAGRYSALLRLRPSVPDNPAGYGPFSDTLHEISGAGNSGSANDFATVPATEAFADSLHMRIEVGMRGGAVSGVRAAWIAQHNLRAPSAPRSRRDSSFNPVYAGATASADWIATQEPTADSPFRRASAGANVAVSSGVATDLVLAEFLPPQVPVFSLAQLQHANLSTTSLSPAYAVGNSLAPYRIPLDQTDDDQGSFSTSIRRVYDLSWLLNRELWDRYFFSTIPDTLTAAELAGDFHAPNARVKPWQASSTPLAEIAGASAFHTAAAHVRIEGGFNINSTSEQAWRAILSASHGLRYDPVSRAESSTPLEYPFSRYASPRANPATEAARAWAGYRTLTPAAIDSLAAHLVAEIRGRGPFLSVADFVNRRLANDDTGFKGTLQAALDAQSADTSLAPEDRVNWRAPFAPSTDTAGQGVSSSNYFIPQLRGGANPSVPSASRHAFAPGYLTQADLLSVLGPLLVARSDTFVIRAYGDVENPLRPGDDPVGGRAWCEAVVQRLPQFVSPEDTAAHETPAPGSLNATWGRRFKIVSFRWLSPDEI